MRLRHSEEDYPDDNFVPPELRQQDYTQDVEAPEMIPSGELAGVDAAPAPASPQGPSREELLRKVLEQQQAHDDARAKKVSNAAKLDRKRQSEDDLGAMLYAATARKSPQFRNVGDSFSKEAAAEGNQGPLSRELALQNLLARYEKKPEDALGTQLKQYQVLKLKKELEAPPKDTSGDFLDESEIAGTEKQMTMAAGMPVKLPRDAQGRVRRSFVGPFNSSSSGMGMMGQKGAIADEGFDLRRLLDAMDRKERAAKEAAAEEKAQQGMEIPGWKRDPNVRMDDAEVRQLRDAKAETESLDASIGNLEAAIKKHGIELNPRSPGYSEISSLMSDVKLKMKGPAAYQLGVLAGPDMAILDSLTGDPTSLRGAFRGTEDALVRLQTARKSAQDRLNSKAASRGYKSAKAATPRWNGRAWEVDDGNP